MYWAVYDKTKNKKLTLAVWDLDGTIGATWLNDWASPEYEMDINLHLIVRLKNLNVDNFNEKANKRYYQLRSNYLSTESLTNRYNDYYELLKTSGATQREEEKWSKNSDVNYEEINFEKEIAYINDWITRHMAFLDTTVFPSETGINTPYLNRSNDDIIYNMNGQRINKPVRGIYLKNGRKYIVNDK
jgi:hypothetical protein